MKGRRLIEVCADWDGLHGPSVMGVLAATPSRGGEVFSFDYDRGWLQGPHCGQLDPALRLFAGPQYPAVGRPNFGLFLDSCPDRWGRLLMRRREAHLARTSGRAARRLLESDYLLGVHDGHRVGGLRFRLGAGPFLDNNDELASPPWTSLRDLEHASLRLEQDDADREPDYGRWLKMLIAPGGSLGGARPKASVRDEDEGLWIAKFPALRDDEDVGAWEGVVHELARRAGVQTPEARVQRFGSHHHTFLSRRFDRPPSGGRLHFASAMTLLERTDGVDAADGVSYLELAELLIRTGARTAADLQQLWRRIVFFVCVSNTDDHLRNHGFLWTPKGWTLAPAYDVNADPYGDGLKLNITEDDNARDVALAMEVAPWFRLSPQRARAIVAEVVQAVRTWRCVAASRGLPRRSLETMGEAFEVADAWRG